MVGWASLPTKTTVIFFRQPENVLFQLTPPALRWARMPTLQTNLRFGGGLKQSSTNEVKLKPTLLTPFP
ncbi:MAG: hypothetical protein J6V99_07790 [Neisseriaceae bacterium]|nr:hypothetical protein [Neisseriaceae bacterium]